jgi:hypothetical protein
MNDELQDEIRRGLRVATGVTALSSAQSLAFVGRVGSKFVEDASSVLWWESLSRMPTVLPYGSESWLDVLRQALGVRGKRFLLAITDESPPPWSVFEADLDSLLHFLCELRYCEYFVSNPELDWVLFDTHHNEIILCDSPDETWE